MPMGALFLHADGNSSARELFCPVVVMGCTNGSLSQGYLLPTPAPAPNSYQHRIAVVGEGGLELVVDTAVSQINRWWYSVQ